MSENYEQNDVFNISSDDDRSDVTSECVSEYSDVSDDHVIDDVTSRRSSSGTCSRTRSRRGSRLSQRRESSASESKNRLSSYSTRSSCSNCGADVDLSGLRSRSRRRGSKQSTTSKRPRMRKSISVESKDQNTVVDIPEMPELSHKNNSNGNVINQNRKVAEGTPTYAPKAEHKVKFSNNSDLDGHSSSNETDELIRTKTETTSKSKKPTENDDIEMKLLNRNVSEA